MAAPPAEHATSEARKRGSARQQNMHNPAEAATEVTARARTGAIEAAAIAAPVTATTAARTQRKKVNGKASNVTAGPIKRTT